MPLSDHFQIPPTEAPLGQGSFHLPFYSPNSAWSLKPLRERLFTAKCVLILPNSILRFYLQGKQTGEKEGTCLHYKGDMSEFSLTLTLKRVFLPAI